MFGKKPIYLSIDIGNRNIKFVLGRFINKKVEISYYEVVDTPENSVSDGKIININSVVSTIQEVITKIHIKPDKLIMTITGTGVITRDIQIPISTEAELINIVEYEAQQYFPVDLTDYTLDYKILEEIKNVDGEFYRVLLVAVPNKQVEEYMKISEILGIDMESIDLPANCVTKFLFGSDSLKIDTATSDSDLPREFAVLDIGSDTIGVCIYSNNRLKFNRILLNGSREIDKLLSYELHIDSEEAENNKIYKSRVDNDMEKWELTGDSATLSKFVKTAVSNIVEDIGRFFEFYNSRGSNNSINKIYIYGGGSKLQGLDGFISNNFNIPVGFLGPLSYVNVEYVGKDKDYEEISEDFVFLISAIGALVRG